MLEILISSSVLIVILAILRLALRDRISARLQYALWLLVLVRLLVPVSLFHSPVSVAEAAAPAVARVERYSDTVLFMGAVSEREAAAPAAAETGSAEVIPTWTLRDAAGNIWFAGMAVMAVWFAAVNIRLALRLRKSRRPYEYHSVMPVYVAEDIPSPCLFGLFRPTVYLTEQAASDAMQARQIIAHELTHYRHGDTIWALLRSVCLVVWWFNPLVWLAAALSRQDCELACDEGTIKALGENARFEYGRTLVGMARVGARPSDLLCGATAMTTGKRSLKERVARIANARKMSVTLAVFVLLIVAVAVGCTYSGAAEAADETVEPEVAVVSPSVEAASASDAEGLPAAESTPTPMLFEDIIDKWYSESSEAVFVSGEPIGSYDREYWEEVDRELASFAYPADIEIYVTEMFDVGENAEPWTLEDLIYSTDSWQFRYTGEQIANDPYATIIVYDDAGRKLWIMDDADALMIEEADGSITWATMPDGVDCADMLRHLFPWARGDYPTEEMKTAEQEPLAESVQ